MQTNYYQILGVDRKASKEEIKAAFKKLALQFHPDRNAGDKNAEEKFKLINEAHRMLSDSEKKTLYDQKLDYASYQNYTRHTPETDKYTRNFNAKHQTGFDYSQVKQDYDNRNGITEKSGWSYHLLWITIGLIFLLAGYLYFSLAGEVTSIRYFSNAILLEKESEHARAMSELNKAIEKDPKFPEAYLLRARIRDNTRQDLNLAVSDYTLAFQYNPKLKKDSTLLRRAICYIALNELDLASTDIKDALELNPIYDSLIYYHALILAKQNYFTESIDVLNRLIDLSPHFQKAYHLRAYNYSKTVQWSKAISDLTVAIMNSPKDAELLYERGQVYYKNNQYELACADWETALSLGNTEAQTSIQTKCKQDSIIIQP